MTTTSLAITAVSSLTTSSLIAAILPNDGAPGRDFRAVAKSLGTSTSYSAFLPSPAAAPVAITYVDGSLAAQGAGGSVTGAYKLHLVPVSTDTTNLSSVLQFLLPPNALVVTATDS
jgi:hypothetical protein